MPDGRVPLSCHEHGDPGRGVEQRRPHREEEAGEGVVEGRPPAEGRLVDLQGEGVGDVQGVDDQEPGKEAVEAADAQAPAVQEDEAGEGVGARAARTNSALGDLRKSSIP